MINITGSFWFQRFFALLIAINFMLNVVQTETLPPADSYQYKLFAGLDTSFTLV